jgi:RNA polymerase sigma factor (sigma-70 family)
MNVGATEGRSGTTTLLLQGCVNGSYPARNDLHRHIFTRIQNLTQKELRRFGRLKREVEPEDVQQEVQIRLDRVLQHDPPPDSPRLWALISMITPQVLIDLHRRCARRPMVLQNQLHAFTSDSCAAPVSLERGTATDDPQRLAQWTEFHDRVLLLPEPQGTVFRLVWYHLKKRKEVAELVQITERSVYNHYRAAWEQLRQYAPLP